MSTRVLIAGQAIDLRDEDVLATGGEAVVYAAGGAAIKIWHVPTDARVRKVEALVARRATWPASLVAPGDLARDAMSSAVVGFAMPRLPGAWEPISLLSLPSWRRPRGLGLAHVARVFVALHGALVALHRAGLVLGDLSDQNVLVDATAPDAVRIVDADSVQLGGLPCEVATEAFLDPALYGPDPADPCATATGEARRFSPESDFYAFAAMFFRAVALVHPYGGALDALPTLPRRALARASVLRADVKVPDRVREAIGLLPQDLRAAFEGIFERGERAPLAMAAIEAWGRSLLACGCGLEMPAEKLPCPRCSARTRELVPATRPGGVRADVVLEAKGPVVALACRDGVVLAIAIERFVPVLYVVRDGHVRRSILSGDAAPGGWDVALASGVAAVAPRGGEGDAPLRVAAIGAGEVHALTTSTERCSGTASFAVAEDTVFRIARGTVLAGRLTSEDLAERPVATVIARRTRLFGISLAGAPATVALGTALAAPRWSLLAPRTTVDLEAPSLAPGEAIVEIAALGDGEGAVVLLRTTLGGRALVRASRFDAQGARRSDRIAAESGRGAGAAIVGAAQRGALITAADDGLVREDLATGASVAFPGSEPFVERGSPLALAPGGVLAAHGRVVRLLRPG